MANDWVLALQIWETLKDLKNEKLDCHEYRIDLKTGLLVIFDDF